MGFGADFLDKETFISRQIVVVAIFGLRHRDQRLILHKICHFQPFFKLGVSKHFSCGPPFAEMPKMSDFSCLGNLRLRCVGTVVCGTKPFSLSCSIRTLIPSEFQ